MNPGHGGLPGVVGAAVVGKQKGDVRLDTNAFECCEHAKNVGATAWTLKYNTNATAFDADAVAAATAAAAANAAAAAAAGGGGGNSTYHFVKAPFHAVGVSPTASKEFKEDEAYTLDGDVTVDGGKVAIHDVGGLFKDTAFVFGKRLPRATNSPRPP